MVVIYVSGGVGVKRKNKYLENYLCFLDMVLKWYFCKFFNFEIGIILEFVFRRD